MSGYTQRRDRLDLWTDPFESPREPEVRPTEPIEARERRALRSALTAALRALGPLDAELLHLIWMHELNELEIRWVVEKQKSIHHRITRAFERLVAGIARLRPELIDRPDPKALKASPPPQSERRQEASRDLRARLAGTVLPAAPARWQRFALIDQPAGTPDSRPKRTRLAPGDAGPDNGLLSDDERAAIALGWLYTCHWSAAETPADRRPRAARLAHLLAMGCPLDEIRADVIAVTDDDSTCAERSALALALHGWLVGELDISDRIARNWLGLPVTDPLDPEEA